MKTTWLILTVTLALTTRASAFCGFYVAKADTKLFNEASKVVIVRDGNRTVLTMANDFKGEPRDFATVIPVPTFLERDQIHVTEMKYVDHLDAYTAPRLVEYFDDDPCAPQVVFEAFAGGEGKSDANGLEQDSKDLGVTIEASYTVGEYDILILSAEESDGLETWLKQNDYKVPEGASKVLAGYIKQGMRFFVAKVNLKEQSKLGFNYLRPLQVAYESPKFMLPIRLGTVNAAGPQELFAFVITRKGRVETTNYKTVKLPSNLEVPVFVKDDFADFYTGMFDHQVKQQGMKTVFMEYAWDMNWCDPCAADPLSPEELRELGVFWQADAGKGGGKSQARQAFVTRLHVRYTAETHPEDLVFQETSDRQNFQGRYILQHPWKGKVDCDTDYFQNLPKRMDKRAENLVSLTGWDLAEVKGRMEYPKMPKGAKAGKWWEKLWSK